MGGGNTDGHDGRDHGLGPMPAVTIAQCYDEMRVMARRILAGNAISHVIQPTELANEAAIRLIRSNLSGVNDESHLLAIAARSMRQILIDEARKQSSAKRDSRSLMTVWPGGEATVPVDLAEIDRALAALTAISPARAEVVELRFMLGMTLEETATATGLSIRTVTRHWQAARGWLLAQLDDHRSG